MEVRDENDNKNSTIENQIIMQSKRKFYLHNSHLISVNQGSKRSPLKNQELCLTWGSLWIHLSDRSSVVMSFNRSAVSEGMQGFSEPIMPPQKPNAHSEKLLVKCEL